MKTSLKDIAETLKLSKTTISWVLSGKGDEKGISLATQEKVFQCATQLGNCLLKLFVDLFLRNAKLFGNLLVTLSLQPPGLEYLLRQFRHLFELGPAYFENFVPEQDVRVATLDSSGIVIHCAALFEFDLFVYGLSYLLIPAIHQAIVPDDFIQIGFDVRPVNVVAMFPYGHETVVHDIFCRFGIPHIAVGYEQVFPLVLTE